jgi:hypothetical protein
MNDATGLAEVLLGLDGFRVLGVDETSDEVIVTVETAADFVGCSTCGVRAEAQDRVRVDIRDLPCFGRPARLVWMKQSDPTRMCELLVGLPEVVVLGIEHVAHGPLRVHVETASERPGCTGCGVFAQVKDRPVVELVDLPGLRSFDPTGLAQASLGLPGGLLSQRVVDRRRSPDRHAGTRTLLSNIWMSP